MQHKHTRELSTRTTHAVTLRRKDCLFPEAPFYIYNLLLLNALSIPGARWGCVAYACSGRYLYLAIKAVFPYSTTFLSRCNIYKLVPDIEMLEQSLHCLPSHWLSSIVCTSSCSIFHWGVPSINDAGSTGSTPWQDWDELGPVHTVSTCPRLVLIMS